MDDREQHLWAQNCDAVASGDQQQLRSCLQRRERRTTNCLQQAGVVALSSWSRDPLIGDTLRPTKLRLGPLFSDLFRNLSRASSAMAEQPWPQQHNDSEHCRCLLARGAGSTRASCAWEANPTMSVRTGAREAVTARSARCDGTGPIVCARVATLR